MPDMNTDMNRKTKFNWTISEQPKGGHFEKIWQFSIRKVNLWRPFDRKEYLYQNLTLPHLNLIIERNICRSLVRSKGYGRWSKPLNYKLRYRLWSIGARLRKWPLWKDANMHYQCMYIYTHLYSLSQLCQCYVGIQIWKQNKKKLQCLFAFFFFVLGAEIDKETYIFFIVKYYLSRSWTVILINFVAT